MHCGTTPGLESCLQGIPPMAADRLPQRQCLLSPQLNEQSPPFDAPGLNAESGMLRCSSAQLAHFGMLPGRRDLSKLMKHGKLLQVTLGRTGFSDSMLPQRGSHWRITIDPAICRVCKFENKLDHLSAEKAREAALLLAMYRAARLQMARLV